VVEVDGRADLVHLTGTGMRRLSGATLEPVKAWGEPSHAQDGQARYGGLDWRQVLITIPAALVQPPPALDGDRVLVWASRTTPSLLGVSWNTGRILWWHRAWPDLPPGTDPAHADRHEVPGTPPAPFHNYHRGRVVGEPLVSDIDGTPAVVATFAADGEWFWAGDGRGGGGMKTTEPQEWVEAVSCRTGETLWRHPLGPRSGSYPLENMRYGAAALESAGRPVVALLANRRLIVLDLRTGRPVGEHDLEPVVGRSADYQERAVPRFGDFGEPGVLLAFADHRQPAGAGREVQLAAVALRTGQPVWQRPVPAHANFSLREEPAWPLTADLDGDGRPEVVAAYPVPSRRNNAAAVEVLDGATGGRRWRHEFPTVVQDSQRAGQWLRLTAGPDLDGDGRREVFVASRYRFPISERQRLFVEALSGADGRPLWRWSHPFWGGDGLGPPRWWGREGTDDRPLLVVPLTRPVAFGATAPVFVLDAGAGRLVQILDDFPDPRAADLDGDGLLDLWSFYPHAPPGTFPSPGRLQALKGVPPEAWRRLGEWLPAADLDGDGVTDLVSSWAGASGTVAVSGADGRVLWEAADGGQIKRGLPLPHGDLDGDGRADLFVYHPSEGVAALSGASGRRLWRSDLKGRSAGSRLSADAHRLELHDLDGDGVPEAVVGYSYWLPAQQFARHSQPELSVLSLKDGRVLWQAPYGRRGQSVEVLRAPAHYAVADLDGDGALDLATWAASSPTAAEVRALRGRDGSPLWTQPLSAEASSAPCARLAAGDLGGRSAVVVVGGGTAEAFHGASGESLWSWQGTWPPSAPAPPVPVFLDMPDGGRGVGVGTWEERVDTVVVLDARGRELRRVGGLHPLRHTATDRLRAHDLDGDGKAEVLSIAGGKLRATRAGFGPEQTVWEWPLPGNTGEVLDVLPDGVIVVRSGNAAVGVDGGAGRPLWRCEGPCPPTGVLADAAGAPSVLFTQEGGATFCRRAVEVDEEGRYRAPPASPRAFTPLPEDPRRLVPLPWAGAGQGLGGKEWAAVVVVQVMLVLTFLLGRAAVRSLRRRAWGVALVLGVLLVAGLALGSGLLFLRYRRMLFDEGRTGTLGLLLTCVLAGGPLVLFAAVALKWAALGWWRRLGGLLALALAAAAAVAVAGLIGDARLAPTQRYHFTLDGWYVLPLAGAYVIGALVPLAVLVRAAVRGGRRAVTAARSRFARETQAS
jgi:outer membrane protein assembly factor BamB